MLDYEIAEPFMMFGKRGEAQIARPAQGEEQRAREGEDAERNETGSGNAAGTVIGPWCYVGPPGREMPAFYRVTAVSFA
jgi:hypothetical protein